MSDGFYVDLSKCDLRDDQAWDYINSASARIEERSKLLVQIGENVLTTSPLLKHRKAYAELNEEDGKARV